MVLFRSPGSLVAAASQAVIAFRKRAGGGPRPRSFSAFQALKLVEAQGFPILLTTMQGERSRYRGTARVRSRGKRKSPRFPEPRYPGIQSCFVFLWISRRSYSQQLCCQSRWKYAIAAFAIFLAGYVEFQHNAW